MQFTAAQIANLIGGRIEGNPESTINRIDKIEEATASSLCFLANPKYEEYLYSTKASVVIINEDRTLSAPVTCTLIRVKDAYASFAFLLKTYNQMVAGEGKTGIESPSYIAPDVQMGKDVYVGAFSYISKGCIIEDKVQIYPGCFIGENVVIKKHSILYPQAKIYHDCKIGVYTIIHAGVVIGSDGFGFAPQADGSYEKVPQMGNVVVEDYVEIGANTTIDRATMGSTKIGKGVKLDNLIQIAHNVEIGESSVIAAQTGISGSTKLGKNCMVGGQVGIVGHIHLADGTKINAQSGVSKSITQPNQAVTGSPAYDYKSSLKSQAIFRNLPNLGQKIKALEEELKLLKEQFLSSKI